MKFESLDILRSCDRVSIVAVDGGYSVVAECRGDYFPLQEDGKLMLFPDPIDAAESIKHAIRPGISIALPLEFFDF